jgi:hypothetical protein
VFVEIDSFAQGSEGLGILQYRVPFVRLAVGCLTYVFRRNSQDVLIGFNSKRVFNSISSAPSVGFFYSFVPDLNELRQNVTFNLSSLTALNLAIATHAGSQYAVGVFAAIPAPTITATVTATLNIQQA